MTSPSKNGRNATTEWQKILTRNKADEERERKREYMRKCREDEQFRQIEAERSESIVERLN
jgi:hypothetical protein